MGNWAVSLRCGKCNRKTSHQSPAFAEVRVGPTDAEKEALGWAFLAQRVRDPVLTEPRLLFVQRIGTGVAARAGFGIQAAAATENGRTHLPPKSFAPWDGLMDGRQLMLDSLKASDVVALGPCAGCGAKPRVKIATIRRDVRDAVAVHAEAVYYQ